MRNLIAIAVRNVLRNKRRTLITLLALLVGVGVMVSIRGLLNGLQSSMIESATKGQTGALQVHKKGYLKNVLASPLDLDIAVDEAFLQKIKAVPHVTAVAPRILFAGMVNVEEETLFVQIFAVDPLREFAALPKRKEVLNGPAAAFAQGAADNGIVVTAELAQGLIDGKKRKDFNAPTAVLAPDKDGALSAEEARILGTMTLTSPGEKKVAMVPLALAQRLLKLQGRATEIAVAIDDLDHLDAVRDGLQVALGPDYEVHRWDEIALFFKDIVFRQNLVLSIVATVFMILMLLGVANTMLMAVLDRTREIGTMMAVGVRRGRILVLFLLEALTIGVLGGLSGGALGGAVVAYMNARTLQIALPTSPIPFVVVPYVTSGYIATVVGVAGLGAVVFALYPAWRASRMRPVQALAGG
ncbi:MAG: ABC transporter permease [Deltaproteobacteria bacterium]|nr:ABC transporter permease [Deltaproteobacteria bacterium]